MTHRSNPRPWRLRHANLDLEKVQQIRAELDAALIPIARRHYLSMGTLLKLAKVGGSAQV